MRLATRSQALRLVAAMILAACGGGNAASQLVKPPEYAPKDQTKCGVEKSQARPLIVEWNIADRQELESKVRQGVVVVRYHGCTLDPLFQCSVAAKYGYQGTTRAQDQLVIKDEDDLYAKFPVGAVDLEAKLQHSGRLTVDMNLVGRYEAQQNSVSASDLQGDCVGATHFIYGLSVGAFDFYADANASVGGGVGVGGTGAGANSQATRETLTKNGDPDACAKATPDDKAPPAQCGALIRIEVIPLGEAKAVAPAPAPAGVPAQAAATPAASPPSPRVQCPPGSNWNGSTCMGNTLPPFDRAAAAAALNAVDVSSCKSVEGLSGQGRVRLSFTPEGAVDEAAVQMAPFEGTRTGGCVAAKFRLVRIPAFSGPVTTVGKGFTIP